jgi:hypothetical protein
VDEGREHTKRDGKEKPQHTHHKNLTTEPTNEMVLFRSFSLPMSSFPLRVSDDRDADGDKEVQREE